MVIKYPIYIIVRLLRKMFNYYLIYYLISNYLKNIVLSHIDGIESTYKLVSNL